MDNPVLEARRLGQSIWYDNIRRGLITSGALGRLIETGVTGLTSNPTIFERAIAGSTDYDEALLGMTNSGKSTAETFEALAIDDIRAAADLLLPIYEATGGVDGYASLEVSPTLAHDTEGTVAEAERLYSVLDRPNVMIKVPATPEGTPAVRRLIARGINVNVTLIFSLDAYRDVVEAYIRGLEELTQNGGGAGGVASVASFFISRIDTAVDALIEERGRLGQDDVRHLLGKAAIANAKLAYKAFRDTFHGERFAALAGKGARVQRPLWASTGTKNSAYSDVLYMDSLIGPDTVNTVPPATLTAFLEHGTASPTLERDLLDAQETMQALGGAGIDVKQVTSRLLADGVKSFAESFEKLLANIEEKRARLVAGAHVHPGAGLGPYLTDVEETVADLQNKDVVGRIWRKDHTVWQPSPEEITNRLGWLNVTDQMGEQAPSLVSFAQEVRNAGFRHVVLLGMGGSSMGPAALRQTFGSAEGYPELMVLDSTVPSWVEGVAETIDPSRTLFLVSSKSGTTVETLSLYHYFRGILERKEGTTEVGSNFVAITDAGTPLERLAREQGFRRVFCNPSDLGGRYSVLSYFGLVPGALMGIDIDKLLDRAECMREGCSFCVAAHDNPGAWLGASMGILAMRGRDKLTLVTSLSISGFGLWLEQLVAESTGKKSQGIVPIVDEPLVSPSHYGLDRQFVYLRLEGDDNVDTDARMKDIEAAGHPVIRLDLRDRYDLAAEFFRWEFATAVAGSIMGIHPFDQPNVQQAKDLTDDVLREYQASGDLRWEKATDSLEELLTDSRPGDYLAILAYVRQTPETDRALYELRRKVVERYGIATTAGYGPRYLHSTGQLHKGGPDTGLFLQITSGHEADIEVPGKPFTFGTLAEAQALGDLRALRAPGRRVARLHLDRGDGASIRALSRKLG